MKMTSSVKDKIVLHLGKSETLMAGGRGEFRVEAADDGWVSLIALCLVCINLRIVCSQLALSNCNVWRRGGLIYARLRIEQSGFEPWPRAYCFVLGQDTLPSQYLSPARSINGYWQIFCWG